MTAKINKNSTVSMSLVITISSIAFASGMLWMKIETFDTRIAKLETKIEEIHDYLKPNIIALNK